MTDSYADSGVVDTLMLKLLQNACNVYQSATLRATGVERKNFRGGHTE